ncbi:hypothetical protein Clow_01366 [Corynebacterium lowii]|uniref:Uncharacterized protein n=1 Tax=Corynebacterium lowii TaxID=1544413 RepID=A0A0Q1E1S2_9CORY|nr:hypothetical protein Clow_01366 [Corynebacterium lowii]
MSQDRSMWKMNPQRLEEHLKLKNRARRIPDKKKQANKRACRKAGPWPISGYFSRVERKLLVRSCCGLSSTCSGVPASTTVPSAMNTT